MDRALFLIHTGKVALYTNLPVDGVWPSPVAIYGHGWFVNRDFVLGRPTQHYAVAVEEGQAICWTRQLWWKMFAERPAMASEIMTAVYSQQSVDLGSTKWMAELQIEEQDVELEEQFEAENEPCSPVSKAKSSMEAQQYSEIHRALLPPKLKELIDSFEVAEAFGSFGAYDVSNDNDSVMPDLPESIGIDLEIAFTTNCVLRNGEQVLPSEQSMTTLAYAGIPRVPVRYSEKSAFTQEEFQTLGHHACMARLSGSVVKKLREILAAQQKKHAWRSRLEPHQVAILLKEAGFPRCLNADLVQGLMEDIPLTSSDEDILFSICSRLFRWHEYNWHLLVAVKNAASAGCDISSMTFSKEALAKRLIDNKVVRAPEGHEEYLQMQAESKASEMLWAADWPRRNATDALASGAGKRLHIYDAALAVVFQTSDPSGSLKTPPLPSSGRRNSRGRISIASGGSGTGSKTFQDFTKLIIHLPDLDESYSEFRLLHDRLATPAEVETPFEDGEEVQKERESFQRQTSPDSKVSSASSASLTSGTTTTSSQFLGPLTWRQTISITLEDPAYSTVANYISLVMGVLILISIATMFVRPVIEHGREEGVSSVEDDIWFVVELILTAVFSLEYLVRLIVADSLGKQTTCQFIYAPTNICDFTAIIPFYVEVALGANAEEFRLLRVVRLLRLTRIARIGRLANRSELFPPIAMVLLVIWFIYMKTGLSDSK